MTLQDWLSNGWLKQHTTSRQEIRDLLDKVDRDIAEASKEEITLDWRLAIAYNACLGCATIALRVSGYRMPGGTGQHYRTINQRSFLRIIRGRFHTETHRIISRNTVTVFP